MKGRVATWSIRLLRVTVTLALLVYVIRRAGGAALLGEFLRLSPPAMMVATACTVVFFVLATLRWRVLISPAPVTLSFPRLMRGYLLSYFYGALGPGTLGLDAMRTLVLSRHGTGRTAAAVSVTADRVIGVLGLATLGGPSLVTTGLISKLAALAPPRLVGEISAKALAAITALAREPWRLGVSFVVTLAAMTVWAAVAWWTLVALGESVPFISLVAVVASAELISAIPVSVQGIGVRELVLTSALATHGVAAADATLLGLLLYAQGLGLTCAGGVLSLVAADAVDFRRAAAVDEVA